MGFKLLSEGKGRLQMGNNILNKGAAAKMCKANNLVWQKHRIYEENQDSPASKGLEATALAHLWRQDHMHRESPM